MIVFKNKVIGGGGRRGGGLGDDDNASLGGDSVKLQKAALSSLSKQERLLLLELQRTRQSIVTELNRLDPSISADSWLDVQETISTYQSKISRLAREETLDGRQGHVINLSASSERNGSAMGSMSSIGSVGSMVSPSKYQSVSSAKRSAAVSAAAAIPVTRIRTGIDMLPVLATTGESAMEVGIRKQGELRLPVFKLPAIDAARLASLSMEDMRHATATERQGGSPESHSSATMQKQVPDSLGDGMQVSLRSERTFHRVRLAALEYVAHLLAETRSLAPLDVAFMKRHLRIGDRDLHDVEDELERRVMLRISADSETSGTITIFLKARKIFSGHPSSSSSSSIVPIPPRPGSSFLDASSVDGSMAMGGLSVVTFGSLASTRGQQLTARSSGGNSKKRTASAAHFSPSELLKTELMQSLRTMQHHTERVKDGIAAMQSIVSAGNPKAKLMLASVAAERMSEALYKIASRDIQRGFASWNLAVQQIHRVASSEKVIKFLRLRKFSRVLGEVAHRCLEKRLVRWVNFTRKEAARIVRLQREAAVCVLQRYLRGCMARDRVNRLRDSRKFKELYTAVIKIQAQIKGRLVKWKYAVFCRKRTDDRAARKIQRVQRGHRARKRVRRLRNQRNKGKAATIIQALARGRRDRLRVRGLNADRHKKLCAVKIQTAMRGYLARTHTKQILHKLHMDRAVRKVQAVWRGAIARMGIGRKKRELREYKETRYKAARDIQKVARGFRSRMTSRMKKIEAQRKKRRLDNAATRIITMCRGFAARALVRGMRKARQKQMLDDARSWVETWSDDADAFFFFNAATGETLWEPPSSGYSKADGSLILATGEVITDPDVLEAEEAEKKRQMGHICSECNDRIAIKLCNECGDNFCTPCFRTCHTAGARRLHTHSALGPLDCSECEMLLAERWCVSCDEAFCDGCWRKVHARGKRRFHPFSDVSARGKVDSRVYTIDGSEVPAYSAAYVQDQWEGSTEEEKLNEANSYIAQQAAQKEAEAAQWGEYTDDSGFSYYFNYVTGVSQYEYPW